MKKCNRCKNYLPNRLFHKDSTKLDKLYCICKFCRKIKIKVNQKNCKFCRATFNKKHNRQEFCSFTCFKLARIKYSKKRYLNDIENIRNHAKEYYQLNKEREQLQSREYYSTHKKEVRDYQTKYLRIKRKTDSNYRIKHSLSNRVRLALKGNPKLETTMNLVGCSIEFLREHLESKFTIGMNWENYGKWEIDHIKPCCSFDLSKVEEQRRCFHYTNLQPLWKEDNRRKHDS
jgi:hypothetical protein